MASPCITTIPTDSPAFHLGLTMRKYEIYLFYYFYTDETTWIGSSFDHELWIVKILSSARATPGCDGHALAPSSEDG